MKHTVSEVELKNGARGLLIDVPGATVMSFQFHFRAGNRFARDKSIEQTAHIMEHMAFGANSKFGDAHAYEAEFTRNGAYHNAYTTDFSMVYHGDCADFEWERILQLKQLAITKPKFNEEELEAERGNVKSELNGYLNDHHRLLWPKMMKNLGEDTLTFGEALRTVPNVSLKDVREHYRRTHTLSNMRFIIAGKMYRRKKRIIELLESWDLPAGERLLIPIDEQKKADPILIRRKEASNLTFGWLLSLPRRLSDAELDAMSVVDHILNGTLHSRIYGNARKRGLAYGVFSSTASLEHNSEWEFGADVDLDTATQLIDIIVEQVGAMRKGNFTEEEIDQAKQYALGRHQMGAQTVGQISRFYANRYFSDGWIEDYESRPQAISGVTKKRIVDTIQEFLNANCWIMGGVGNTDKTLVDDLQARLETIFE